MENIYEYLKAHKGQATIEKLFILADLMLFENEQTITQPVYKIIEGYFRDFARDTHDNYGTPAEGVEQYKTGVEMAHDLLYGVGKEQFDALKPQLVKLTEQQREYAIAALRFVQWALLEDDELTDKIHSVIHDYYESKNYRRLGKFEATIASIENHVEVNEIFDTFDTGDNAGTRGDLDAIIDTLENGTGADA